jgi:hypothetical protein
MGQEMHWCSVCGRFTADVNHEDNPRFAEYHTGSESWDEALAELVVPA